MMESPLTASDAENWTYRGEGAANLVLGYRGSSPSFMGKVLRVQKVPTKGGVPGAAPMTDHERLVWGDVQGMAEALSRDEAGAAFVLEVMRDLLGHHHVDLGVNIPVSKEFLEMVEKNIAELRPSWRVDDAIVNVSCDHALLMPDHAVFHHDVPKCCPCFTVEIKPKCGFIPLSEFISEKNSIKKHVTRFRMHQLLKLSKGEIQKLSEYDPIDLFSGSRDQIGKAITALFKTPQNNLRIFLNGSIIFGGLGGTLDRTETHGNSLTFEDSIMKPLIEATDGLKLSTFQDLLSEAILRSRVLDRLMDAQKLDKIDVEGAIHAYYNIIGQTCLVCGGVDAAAYSHRYASLHSLTLEESVKIVKEYLIAATAKDCSLMISFRPVLHFETTAEQTTIFLESANQKFEYKASFIDLDLKPLDKMVYYYELDQKIVKLYKIAMEKANLYPSNDIGGKLDDGYMA